MAVARAVCFLLGQNRGRPRGASPNFRSTVLEPRGSSGIGIPSGDNPRCTAPGVVGRRIRYRARPCCSREIGHPHPRCERTIVEIQCPLRILRVPRLRQCPRSVDQDRVQPGSNQESTHHDHRQVRFQPCHFDLGFRGGPRPAQHPLRKRGGAHRPC